MVYGIKVLSISFYEEELHGSPSSIILGHDKTQAPLYYPFSPPGLDRISTKMEVGMLEWDY